MRAQKNRHENNILLSEQTHLVFMRLKMVFPINQFYESTTLDLIFLQYHTVNSFYLSNREIYSVALISYRDVKKFSLDFYHIIKKCQ